MLGLPIAHSQDRSAERPPKTRMDDVRETLHGVEVSDPYRWLEEREEPETAEWIEAQNRYTDEMIGALPGREALKQRLTELMRVDWVGMPLVRNGVYFFAKRARDQELPVICMRKGLHGKDDVLIDPHPLSPDHTTSVGMFDVSQDGTLMAYNVREGGQDEVVVKLLDVEKRTDLPDALPRARYFDCCLRRDKSGFYYSRHRDEGPRICYHTIGSDPASDTEIFGEKYGPDKGIGINLSEDGRYLLITVWHGSAAKKTEIYFQDVSKKSTLVPVVDDIDARFVGEVGGDSLFLWTNWQAPKGRILRVDLNNPARDRWREIIPESDAVIEGFSLAGGKLFVNYVQNVRSRLRVFDPDGTHLRDIALPAIGSVGTIAGRWTSNEAFFSFSSFHIPPVTYRHDVLAGNQDVWWRSEVPADSERIDVRQVWYTSKDGTQVPMFIVHDKRMSPDESHPTILTGYGGFNASLTPWFSPEALSWVENGGIFAVANLRGGGEFGEEWHQAGTREKKQNVFDDFIGAAEWLIAKGLTEPAKLAITGGSNGGLLVGAALTQRPDMFQAAVCSHPLLDMVRYHKFLVAGFWVPEFGSSEDPGQFRYLYAYSPYHRVQEGREYPAVLFITGDADTRVDPLHARKMAARLQAASASGKPVLLRHETRAGHSGGRPLSKAIEDTTDELIFLFWQLRASFPGRASSNAPRGEPQ